MPRIKALIAAYCPVSRAFLALVMAMPLLVVSQGCGELQASVDSASDAPAAGYVSPLVQSLAPTTPGLCDLSGTWAAHWSVAVQWDNNLGLAGGEGHIEHWALIQRTQAADGTWAEAVTPCGLRMPSYKSLPLFGSEHYAMAINDRVFDGDNLPTTVTQLRHETTEAGQTFAGGPYVFEMGLALDDAAHQLWPTRRKAFDVYLRDHDGDGAPGVSMVPSTDGYVQPAVNMMRTRRAQAFHVAMRHVVGAQGKVVDCDTLAASDLSQALGGAPTFESRTLGCSLTDGGSCTAGEATLATKYAPKYHVVDGSQMVQRRVQAATTCAQVRAMTY